MSRRSFPFRHGPSSGTTAIVVAVWIVLVASLTACGGVEPDPVPTMRVTVDGEAVRVELGTTFGKVIRERGLVARDGRLLSVGGSVLDPSVDPGTVLLDGRPAPATTRLERGDRIRVHDGRDRVEAVRVRRERLPGLHPTEPRFTLRRYRILRITRTGRTSGELAGVRDVPIGEGRAPRAVALTFDDGPWPGATERVLRILRRFRVPATFFVVGEWAQRAPGLIRRIARRGHAIGSHSMTHPTSPPFAELPEARIQEELDRTDRVLQRIGIEPVVFRPPGGSFDDGLVDLAEAAGMRVVLWDVDPRDWDADATAKDVVRRVLRQVRAGSIVLLHDGGGDAGHTIKALPELIRGIRRRGLGFVTLGPPARLAAR
jgi:peptidoglycan/xylan/chitin deacetylase (PgdA/CDA1 family)/sulfur carrier protein ThiS